MGSEPTRRGRARAAALTGAAIAASVWLGALMAGVTPKLLGAPAAAAGTLPPGSSLGREPASRMAGNPAGSVTIVEFFDYRCPYCRAMQPTLHKLVADDARIRLVFKDWPTFGGVSIYAAKVAIAAGWQGRYVPVHDALFAVQGAMDRAAVRAAAAGAGVNMTRLDGDLTARDGDLTTILADHQAEAHALGLQGTPGFVIGRTVVPGALSYTDMEDVVAKAAKAKS